MSRSWFGASWHSFVLTGATFAPWAGGEVSSVTLPNEVAMDGAGTQAESCTGPQHDLSRGALLGAAPSPMGEGYEVQGLVLEGDGTSPVPAMSWWFPRSSAGGTLQVPLRGLRPGAGYRVRVRRHGVQGAGPWTELEDSAAGWLAMRTRAVSLWAVEPVVDLATAAVPLNIQPAAEGTRLVGKLWRLEAPQSRLSMVGSESSISEGVLVAETAWFLAGPSMTLRAGGLRPETRYRLTLEDGLRRGALHVETGAAGAAAQMTPTAVVWPP